MAHHAGPLRVGLGRPQRLAVLRHVQDVGVQLGRHGDGEVGGGDDDTDFLDPGPSLEKMEDFCY